MKAKFVFERLQGKEKSNSFWSLGMECPLWDEFNYFELTENVRQKNDPAFQELLSNVRVGNTTEANIDVLKQRQEALLQESGSLGTVATIADVANLIERKSKEGVQTMYLSPKNSGVDCINEEMIKRTDKDVFTIEAQDQQHTLTMKAESRKKTAGRKKSKVVGTQRKKKISETAGLETSLQVFDGARVILLRNKDVSIHTSVLSL